MKFIRQSISRKLMLLVLSTTFLALLIYGVAMLAYDLRTYHESWVKDLTTQASIIAEVSAPALEFNDPATAQENLELLRTRPAILQAAIYMPTGERFAKYSSAGEPDLQFPVVPRITGDYLIDEDRITVSRRIVKNRHVLGTVYIHARYEVKERLASYALILGCVMAGILALAALMWFWLQAVFTKPIFAVTNVARNVMQSRDFSLRARKFTQDEIGVLVDAFNDMLSEVERRAKALEETNLSLEYEMAERHAAENALLQADKRKDEFLATLAHELRNPLAPLVNSLKILQLSGHDPVVDDKAREVMERQLKQMVRLVDDLLDVSRITTGKLAITKDRVDVRAVMQAAIEATSGFIETCGHTLETRLPGDPVYLDADPVRLAQVFSNLLNNAAKYTNPGGHIGFSAHTEDGHLVVEVADDGIGIDAEKLPEIFEMFTQIDYSLERTHAGLGVGLALARQLIQLHGGTLDAASDGTGCGSSFFVRLPLAGEGEMEVSEQAGDYHAESRCCRVLLVDDNVDFVTTMATLLSGMGHELRTAHDGTAALQTAEEFQPEFAFLDIGMPGLNGYDLARRLREMPATANAILVAVTGWGQQKDRDLSEAAGFDYHLVKPVELGQILEVLERPGKPE